MTKTLLKLAREATPGPWKQHLVYDTTVVAKDFDVCRTFPSGGLDDEVDFTATIEQHEINAAFIAAANPKRIIELCEALEGVLSDIEEYERINNLSPSPGEETCWQSVARARRALNGE